MTNILIVTPFFPTKNQKYSGDYINKQVDFFKRNYPDFNVYIFHCLAVRNIPFKILKDESNRYHQILYPTLPNNKSQVFSSKYLSKKIEKKIKEINVEFDLIHVHFAIPTGISLTINNFFDSIPKILTVHGSDVNKYPNLNKKYYRYISNSLKSYDKVICVSEDLKNKVINMDHSINAGVNYLGVQVLKDKKLKKNSCLQYDSIYVGNVIIEKGLRELLGALKILKERDSRFISHKLLVVGEGKYKFEMERTVNEYNLSENVIFIGSLKNDEVYKKIAQSKILILPSYSEGLPTVLMEAGLVGTPVIATKVGGIPELIEDEYSGILIEPRSEESLVNALLKFYDNNKLVENLGENLNKVVMKKFNQKESIENLHNIYNDIIKRE